MTQHSESIDGFHFGETVEFTIAAKNRDGTVLVNPQSQVLTVMIADAQGAASLLSFNDAPQVVLTDMATAVWTVRLWAADYGAVLVPAVFYRYYITTQTGSDDPMVQAHGRLVLPACPQQ